MSGKTLIAVLVVFLGLMILTAISDFGGCKKDGPTESTKEIQHLQEKIDLRRQLSEEKEKRIEHLQEDIEWYKSELKASESKAVVIKKQAHEKISRVDSFGHADITSYLSGLDDSLGRKDAGADQK